MRASPKSDKVSLLPTNRFEEMSLSSLTCSDGEEEEYIGGYARMVAMVKQLREELADTNPIYLNAGDNFQGTLWYSLGRWNVTAYFLNMLKADAMVGFRFRCFFFILIAIFLYYLRRLEITNSIITLKVYCRSLTQSNHRFL